MILRVLSWFWNRFRPQEGWLSFFLLGAAVACLATAVSTVKWVPEVGIVIPAAIWGLLLGTVLAERPSRPLSAWFLLTVYGFLLTAIWLGNLSPPLSLWVGDWRPFSQHVQQNTALFFDRMASWLVAVVNGGSSQETIAFAWGLGLGVWFLAAFAAWSAFRLHRPLWGVTGMGLTLALNGYFGAAPAHWAVLFVGLGAWLTAVIHFNDQEQRWTTNQIDYSDQIRPELILHAGGVAIILLAFSTSLPGFSLTKWARAFQEQPIVQQAEETLERLFPGVRQRPGQPTGPGGVGGSGILPRSYLLGNPPELSETVVMTAVVTLPDSLPPTALSGAHWRALSYDTYTGRGWALSEERREPIAANGLIPLLPVQSAVEIEQTVYWLQDERVIRYTLGLPLRFDEEVTAVWRGLTDLARVQGEETIYQVTSRASAATGRQLRETAVADIPPIILSRYAKLPDSIPQRVHDLAQEVAGGLPTAYDQARALERFLRQYPYSLDVELPPEDGDPVDFFLFDLQSGYCDYYASAMAVMARSLGLPARMAVGFLPQPPDENGVQTLYQISGHSWTEIYFPEYGWIEFEPTAAFPSPHDSPESAYDPTNPNVEFESPHPDTPAIPPAAPQESVWRRLWQGWNRILLVATLVIGYWLWRRRQRQVAGRDSVVWAYGRLQRYAKKLGQSHLPNQTPNEFTDGLLSYLNHYAKYARLAPLVVGLRYPIERLNGLFVRRRYGKMTDAGMDAAQQSWKQLRFPLWLLRLIKNTVSSHD
ncbi:MAG: transglutaminase domain-containing protein [Chloroflexi bacterium]|nr:transglutaminase domain-containing protein [Chloroflexota bacterium]